jgi:hypothetical protein
MANGHTIILRGPEQRERAKRLIDVAPEKAVVKVRPESRSLDQNARFWAMLSDVSMAKPGGRVMTPERWKAAIMQSFGHAVQFENDLDGRPFPIGHSSSKLTKAQMGELMEFMAAHFTPLGVRWSDGE